MDLKRIAFFPNDVLLMTVNYYYLACCIDQRALLELLCVPRVLERSCFFHVMFHSLQNVYFNCILALSLIGRSKDPCGEVVNGFKRNPMHDA